MPDASTNSTWSPSSAPVIPADFESRVVIVHYWAEWDSHDYEMDRRIAALHDDFAGQICFRSCDIDRADNLPFIHGVANVPALGCFIRGKWFTSLIGLRSVAELREAFARWLTAAAGVESPR